MTAGASAGKKQLDRRSRVEITLIGCNHRTAPVELRERVAFNPEQARRAAEELRKRGILEEAVVLSTCNRSELYGVRAAENHSTSDEMVSFFTGFHQIPAAELNGRLYRHSGRDAISHLFRVAAGLDSMLLGEAEILGQVRDAYGRSLEQGSTGPVLNRLFQSALEVGKRVRADTEVGARPMSVAFAGVKLAERVFGNLKGHNALIIGAGAVAERVVEHLRNRGIARLRLVNRSFERAEELAQRMGGEAVSWAALESTLEFPDIVVTSVSGMGPVLTRTMVERAVAGRRGRAIFLVDLGVPRNVEPAAAELYNVYLYDVDDLGEIVEQNRRAREAELPRAETIIDEHVAKFEAWQSSVEAFALFERLRDHLHAERNLFLQEKLAAMTHLSSEDRQRVSRLTEELIERILEEPSNRFRHTSKLRKRLEAAEALRELFGLESPGDSGAPKESEEGGS